MRNPRFGEASVGALAGAVTGAIGGLFALGLARAIIGRNPGLLLVTSVLNVVCWLICGVTGWLMGGQIGPRLGRVWRTQHGEIVGGILGGLAPVLLFILLGWYLVTAP
jgi:hypothetical protein